MLWTKNVFLFFLVMLYSLSFPYFAQGEDQKIINAKKQKVLICGVCKNVEQALNNTIKNIEQLGNSFSDYAVILYENNSTDNTPSILRKWSLENQHVFFLSETLTSSQLPLCRTENIARARNIVLSLAKEPKFDDFRYIIMADLDFQTPWPIEAILETIELPVEWDCISANGLSKQCPGDYYDRYAFRDKRFPFGAELIRDAFWNDVYFAPFKIEGENLVPVYSAFGGLAIYKKASMIGFCYSGIVTDDLKSYYEKIIHAPGFSNPHLPTYLRLIGKNSQCDLSQLPIIFQHDPRCSWEHPQNYKYVTCCEHVPLHASMAIHGFGKFYINPKMILQY